MVELKDAYFHIPIALHHRSFFQFTFQDESYQFYVLPFSLSLSPWAFTQCIQVALEPLQWEGMLILPYLDDWLLCTRSPMQAANNIHHDATLGLKVNLSPMPASVLPGYALGLQVNEGQPHRRQKAGLVENLSKVPGSWQAAYIDFLLLASILTAASSVIQLELLHLFPFQC